jgi:rubrerythrin
MTDDNGKQPPIDQIATELNQWNCEVCGETLQAPKPKVHYLNGPQFSVAILENPCAYICSQCGSSYTQIISHDSQIKVAPYCMRPSERKVIIPQ